jgi:hypothetical protein
MYYAACDNNVIVDCRVAQVLWFHLKRDLYYNIHNIVLSYHPPFILHTTTTTTTTTYYILNSWSPSLPVEGGGQPAKQAAK